MLLSRWFPLCWLWWGRHTFHSSPAQEGLFIPEGCTKANSSVYVSSGACSLPPREISSLLCAPLKPMTRALSCSFCSNVCVSQHSTPTLTFPWQEMVYRHSVSVLDFRMERHVPESYGTKTWCLGNVLKAKERNGPITCSQPPFFTSSVENTGEMEAHC